MIIKRWPFHVQRLFTAGHEVRLEYQGGTGHGRARTAGVGTFMLTVHPVSGPLTCGFRSWRRPGGRLLRHAHLVLTRGDTRRLTPDLTEYFSIRAFRAVATASEALS